jgi:hypothetical protein
VAEFRAWAFVFESVMEQVYPALAGDFTVIRTMDTSMTIVMPGNDEGGQFERCRMLHFALVISCRDEAQIIVETQEKSNGWAAYRALVANYDPTTSTRGLAMLEAILDFKFTAARWQQDFTSWKLMIARYEAKLGRQMDAETKSSVLLKGLPAVLKAPMRLEAEKGQLNFEQLSAHVQSYMMTTRTWNEKVVNTGGSSSSGTVDPNSMEVDAISKGGKHSGKGGKGNQGFSHKGDHGGKTGGAGTGKGYNNSHFGSNAAKKTCTKCNKAGHDEKGLLLLRW